MTDADQPSMGRFDGRTHVLPVRIYYEDTDFSGLVYHANYVRYFERGRSDFLRAIGISHSALLETDPPTAFALIRLAVEFKKPARIDDALLVATTYDAILGPRLLITQKLLRKGDALAEAAVEACCISLSGRPKKPPATLVDRLTPLLAPAASDF